MATNISSEKFKAMRNSIGLTQKQLSEATGIPLASIKNIEGGKQAPGFTALERLAAFPPTKSAIFWLVSSDYTEVDDPILAINPEKPSDEIVIYKDLLTAIIEAIEEGLTEMRKDIEPGKKAELITLLYTQTVRQAPESESVNLDLTSIEPLLRLAT